MRVKSVSRRRQWLGLGLLLVVGCPGPQKSPEEIEQTLDAVTATRLTRFASREEFDAYVREVDGMQRRGWGGLFGCAASSPATDRVAAESAPAGEESITNNQELGVDEGDIVKAAGDYFVVLRRGRLFAVRHTGENGPTLTAVSRIDASPPGFTRGTWYDEILVRGDRVILVGYSYEVSATELGLFRLSAEGQLSHQATYFLASNDYYSSRNYASRVVGDFLIFYMPYYLPMADRDGGAALPSMRRWVGGNTLSAWNEILDKTETYRPLQRTQYPALHTVVQCDLAAEELSCTARAVVAPYSRSFYVSRDAVYLWVGAERDQSADGAREARATLYRMPLWGGEVTAARVRGMPIDQFSFSERSDGSLFAVASHQGGGDAMWHPELTQGALTLVKVPPAALSPDAAELDAAAYAALPALKASYGLQNRFVGQHLLLGTGTGWDRTTSAGTLWVVPVERPEAPASLELGHDTERLEVLGAGAAVVGSRGKDLVISSVALGDDPEVRSSFTRPEAAQGETRSHGFFFKPDAEGGGVLGLPIRLDGAAYRHLRYGSAEVAFVRVSAALELERFGALAAGEASADDACKVSCTDWYGNARPIFFRGRTFALLGYELVEGGLSEAGLAEGVRVEFSDPAGN